jgi:hypothetical protein
MTPGALIAVTLWILMSLGLQFYLRFFNTYNATYGSLGAGGAGRRPERAPARGKASGREPGPGPPGMVSQLQAARRGQPNPPEARQKGPYAF